MIDAAVAKFYEIQIQVLRQDDYSSFFRDAPQKDKISLLKKAAKIAKHEQLRVAKDSKLRKKES